ncbi:MAG: hypothetical protein ACI4UW_04260 [Muribaculaceae bacterium]
MACSLAIASPRFLLHCRAIMASGALHRGTARLNAAKRRAECVQDCRFRLIDM